MGRDDVGLFQPPARSGTARRLASRLDGAAGERTLSAICLAASPASRSAGSRLSSRTPLFRQREVRKRYLALVEGVPQLALQAWYLAVNSHRSLSVVLLIVTANVLVMCYTVFSKVFALVAAAGVAGIDKHLLRDATDASGALGGPSSAGGDSDVGPYQAVDGE